MLLKHVLYYATMLHMEQREDLFIIIVKLHIHDTKLKHTYNFV